MGGKADNPTAPRSMEYVYSTIDVFEKNGVLYSKFIGGNDTNDLAYFTEKDAFFIGNDRANSLKIAYPDNPLAAAKEIFDEVELCEFDEIKWY